MNLLRLATVPAVLALGALVAVQQDRALRWADQLVVWWSGPAEPGAFVEIERPDLSDGNPSLVPDYRPASAGLESHDMNFGGVTRHWHSLALPMTASGDGLAPLVVLLHGAGRDGTSMLDMWRAVGGQGVVLVAPDAADPNVWTPQDDGPAFLDAVLAAVAVVQPYDRNRVFLYGHSGGARFALYLAACEGGTWRAVAVHAGSIPDCRLRRAEPVPVMLAIGDADPLFPLQVVRETARRLVDAGHDVDLRIIPDHGHWYYAAGPKIAADAWDYLAKAWG